MENVNSRLWALTALRTLNLLAVGLWIGGLAFFGIFAAKPLFETTKDHGLPELAPILVGQMLGRFNGATYVCAVLLFGCWLVDGMLTRSAGQARRWWFAQGAASVGCLILALYLGLVLLPYTVEQQKTILPLFRKRALEDGLSVEEKLTMAKFDVGHHLYTLLSQINLWLLVAVLVTFCARTALESRRSGNAG
jgi:hypothetical protein